MLLQAIIGMLIILGISLFIVIFGDSIAEAIAGICPRFDRFLNGEFDK